MAYNDKYITGGLVGLLYGSVENSYAYADTKGCGIAGYSEGRIKNCYSLGAQELCVGRASASFIAEDLSEDADVTKLSKSGWDFENVWRRGKNGLPVFIKRKWLCAMPPESEFCRVHDAQDLFEIADRVNSGDQEFASRSFLLMEDIDMSGYDWQPIGSYDSPFTGIFDGGGHTVSGLKIRGGKIGDVGFFGYVFEARIVNLSIRGDISGGDKTGGLVGTAEDSSISCCGAVCDVRGSSCIGGLIGECSSRVDRCFFTGKVSGKGIHPLAIAGMAAAGAVAVAAILVFAIPGVYQGIFPGSPATRTDAPSAQPADTITVVMNSELSFAGAQSQAAADIQNPADAGRLLAVNVFVTADDGSRIAVIETGTIPPGYGVTQVSLLPLPDGSYLTPGRYKATAQFSFYYTDTLELSPESGSMEVVIEVLGDAQ